MKTIWELWKEKLSSEDEKKAFQLVKDKLEVSFYGGYGRVPVTTSATMFLVKNPIRKQLYFEADSTNTGVIYLGMDTMVSSTTYFRALNAGDNFAIADYQGEIWVIASVANQQLAYGEW